MSREHGSVLAMYEQVIMVRSIIAIAAIVASLCGGAARSQEPQPAGEPAKPAGNPADGVVGNWELSNADHDKACRLVFRADAGPGGNKLDIDKNCPNIFPSTKDIVAWSVDNYGNLRLLDAGGNAVLELTEVESGMYDGFQPEEGRYILQAAAATQIHSADEMIGDWAIVRGTGKPICIVTLANTAAPAGSDNLALKIRPGCDPMVSRFGPTSWHMGNGELVLLAPRGQTWHFEENDANTWQRLPESADPILLVRQ
ncbi:MAG TPA: AprI/Inh family metalloprotease inhibitor [Xanthobacteraceae bacterium]|nr:AprI/Inh family metalloprotease inhibitor [Xanthobacteraceae bacterium]